MSIYDYFVLDCSGNDISLEKFRGKVLLIVNTATGCGFTPHYEALENMYEAFHAEGLEILDIPCNQFANQTPGSDEEVHHFCQLYYHTQFEQMKKSCVNGEMELPLYHYLKSKQPFKGFGEGKVADMMNEMLAKIDPDYQNNPDIKWNFTKFVVNREGEVVARFEPTADMEEVKAFVQSLL
ncbi:glutathione peroxidase [Treponema rectale]|uniref:Glutathione peroxidase n=1 Tax=Treponema rectale TaxID=744512 RepID=A0A7M1XLJ5_9SPIR|nr:glutathione peroxidase [Treponema rectale]